MPQPTHNPFYLLLLIACAALLVTMFVYLVGWAYVPNPDQPAKVDDRPQWMKWIDRHAVYLIPAEVGAVILLSVLTMTLDRFFEPRSPKGGETST